MKDFFHHYESLYQLSSRDMLSVIWQNDQALWYFLHLHDVTKRDRFAKEARDDGSFFVITRIDECNFLSFSLSLTYN